MILKKWDVDEQTLTGWKRVPSSQARSEQKKARNRIAREL